MVLTHLLIGPPPQKITWFILVPFFQNSHQRSTFRSPTLRFCFFLNNISTLQIEKTEKSQDFFASLSSWSTLRAPTLRNWSCDVPRCLPSCRASCWRPCKATEAAEWRIEEWEGMKHQIFKITKMGYCRNMCIYIYDPVRRPHKDIYAYLPTYIPTYIHTCLPTYIHAYI